MKKFIFCIFLVLSVSGCTTMTKFIPQSGLNVGINLEKSQYDIIGTFKGEATVQRFLFFPIGVERKAGFLYGDSSPIFFGSCLQPAKQMAVYNAIKNNPDVDYMIMPKFDITEDNYFIFGSTTVKATGVGIKIK